MIVRVKGKVDVEVCIPESGKAIIPLVPYRIIVVANGDSTLAHG